jgi:hypothetical protein
MAHPKSDHERPWSVYPTVQLSQHSSILSFPKTTIESPFASSVPSPTSESCYRTITKYSFEEYKKLSENSVPLDAKSYFAKAYGKKDMFSKEVKVEIKLTRPVSVNLEETLLQVSHDFKPGTTSPPPKQKVSTLGNLFGGFDDQDEETASVASASTTTAPPLAHQSSSTFNGFDSFDTFTFTPHSAPTSTTAFDAFASASPSASKPSASFFDAFDTPSSPSSFPAFDSSFDSSFPSSAISEPIKPILREYFINQSVTCFEDLLCLYKNHTIDKFQLTGSLQYQFSFSSTEPSPPEPETNIVASLHINDPSKKLAELLPHSPAVSLQSTNAIQATIPWEEKSVPTEPSTVILAKYLASPSFRPEFFRIRMNISQREMSPPDLPSTPPQPYLVIGIQLMLNKNYPQISYENIQVLCSLTSLPEICGEIKTRPNGIFTQQSKILTWRCGNQSAGKQALLQMEATVPLQQSLSPIPSALPVIVKAVMTDTPIVTDCVFVLDPAAVVMKDPTLSSTVSLTSTTNPAVGYKSKIEYRFL